jgi:hypothetical protein
MDKYFTIHQDGDKQIIERLSYPRFKGEVTFNGFFSDIENIELLDETTDPTILAMAMREAGEFLLTYKKDEQGNSDQ